MVACEQQQCPLSSVSHRIANYVLFSVPSSEERIILLDFFFRLNPCFVKGGGNGQKQKKNIGRGRQNGWITSAQKGSLGLWWMMRAIRICTCAPINMRVLVSRATAFANEAVLSVPSNRLGSALIDPRKGNVGLKV